MTRNWKGLLLALAAVALTGPAPAQQPSACRQSCPSNESNYSAPFSTTGCGSALGECSAVPAENRNACARAGCGVCASCGAEAFIRSMERELLTDCRNAYRAGDLARATTLARQAVELQPNCLAARHALLLLELASRLRGGAEECNEPRATCACGAECCCAKSACKCGEKCGCKATAPKVVPMPPAPPAVNDPIELQCEALEIRRPVVIGTQAVSPPCAEPRVELPMPIRELTPIERPHRERSAVTTPGIQATADHVRVVGTTAYLDGRVELIITKENHPGRILTDRATVNLREDSYEVMPVHFEGEAWKARTKPVLRGMLSPMERGWR